MGFGTIFFYFAIVVHLVTRAWKAVHLEIGILDIVIRIVLAAATAALFTIVFVTYLRVRSRKLIFISAGFGIFFAQSVFTIPELFMGFQVDENLHLFLHVIVLSLILVGILKD
jgi:hypothetical protein